MNRYWNVTAGLAGILVLGYVGICAAGWFKGSISFTEFKDAVQPVLLPVIGAMVALIPKATT